MIAITERDGIAIMTLAHGKANTMDTEFCAAVTKSFVKLKSAKARAVVLTGQGGMFSAGV
jgi:enoyl-CoA hydratase